MGKSESSQNSMSSRVENQLRMIELRARSEVQKERVAKVYCGVNERRSNSSSSSNVM